MQVTNNLLIQHILYGQTTIILFSDKNSPCCHLCQYMAVSAKCRTANYATCEKEAECSGVSAQCPKSEHMADGTNCIGIIH